MAEPLQATPPFAAFDIPEGIRARDLSSLLGVATDLRKLNEESEAAAIRYQGQMDYMDMIRKGASHRDAFIATAPKMFYRNPGGMSQAFRELAPTETGPIQSEDVKNEAGQSVGTVVTLPGGRRQIIPARRGAADDYTKDVGFMDLTQQINLISRELQDKKREVAKQSGLGEQFADVGLLRQARLLQEELDRKMAERRALVASRTGASSAQTQSQIPARQTAAPAAVQNETLPMPASKDGLVPGRIYNTRRGPARWDGEKFIQD